MATTYCTTDDVKRVVSERIIIQLLDDDNEGDLTFDEVETALEGIINDVESIIDTYLKGRYTTPLTTVPAMIEKICIDLTRYELYDRRGLDIPESVKEARDLSIRRLEQIQKGILQLTIEGASGYYVQTNKTADDRMFGNNDDVDSGNDVGINLDNFGIIS